MTASEPIYMIPQALYDKVADLEGIEGCKIHSVDRVAGVLMFGDVCFQVQKPIPFERGVFDGIRFLISKSDDMASHNLTVKAIGNPRGAQWKRETRKNRSHRA